MDRLEAKLHGMMDSAALGCRLLDHCIFLERAYLIERERTKTLRSALERQELATLPLETIQAMAMDTMENGRRLAKYDPTEGRLRELVGLSFYEYAEMIWLSLREHDSNKSFAAIEKLMAEIKTNLEALNA